MQAVERLTGLDLPENVPQDRVFDVDIYALPGDHLDAQMAWRNLRAEHDIIWTPRNGGHWISLGADVIEHIYRSPELFSSRESGVPVGSTAMMLPLQGDGAIHAASRQVFDPWFRPSALEPFRQQAQSLAIELIEGFRPRGRCEFVSEFGQVLPLVIFLSMVDLPLDDREMLHAHVEVMLHESDLDRRQAAYKALTDYLEGWMEERRKSPGNDALSDVVTAQLLGRPITDDEAMGMGALLLLGGLDTVASMMGFIMKFLATHPGHRRWIVEHPNQLGHAIEELMRRHGVATNHRVATQDVEIDGVVLREGDIISTPTAAHGLDERRYDDARTVDFEREPQPTLVFGAGPHRCPGMNLARLELRILLTEWLSRIPEFELDPNVPVRQLAGSVNGVLQLGLRWEVD